MLDLKLAPVSAKVEVIEKRMDAQDERLTKVEARLNGGNLAGSQDSSCSTGSSQQAARFAPSFVEIKGFCAFGEKRTSGITRDEAENLVQTLVRALPTSIQARVGELEVYGKRGHKVKVHVRPPHAVEVAAIWRESLEDIAFNFNGRKQFTTCEREPHEQKQYACAGKTRAYLEAKVRAVGDLDATVLCSWSPDWNLIITKGNIEAMVAQVQADASLAWSAEGLRSVFAVSVEATQKEYAAWKQA